MYAYKDSYCDFVRVNFDSEFCVRGTLRKKNACYPVLRLFSVLIYICDQFLRFIYMYSYFMSSESLNGCDINDLRDHHQRNSPYKYINKAN